MAKWVKLPDDAQVTMSRESWESTRGIGPLGKVAIAIMLVLAVYVLGHGGSDETPDHKSPTPTHSAPVKGEGA